jgi:hypothetical protein
MNNLLLAALPIVAALASPLRAADPIQTQWHNLCRVSQGHSLQITTSTGEIVEGVCVAINVDEVSIRTVDNRIVKIGRRAYSRILLAANDRHPLRSLGKGMKKGFRDGFNMLLSPMAPAGIVVLPVTVAWGAVSAPFCALGELKGKFAKSQEIEVR